MTRERHTPPRANCWSASASCAWADVGRRRPPTPPETEAWAVAKLAAAFGDPGAHRTRSAAHSRWTAHPTHPQAGRGGRLALILTIGIVCACLLLAALIDTADRSGNRQSALLQCSTLNVLLWVLLAFWFGAARRSGWPGDVDVGPLMFAWATVATLALFWWLLISTRGPVVAAPTRAAHAGANGGGPRPAEPEKRLPRIGGKICRSDACAGDRRRQRPARTNAARKIPG